jgi:hypothetical protein
VQRQFAADRISDDAASRLARQDVGAAASALGTKVIYMMYVGGQWYYDPTNGWIYFGHSVSHAIAKAKGQGLCGSVVR